MRMSQLDTAFQELAAFRKDEGDRMNRLEKAIKELKPAPVNTDPTTDFWTVYKKVADEHDNDLLNKYAGDLDTSLLFAGLFSAVATTFIVQIIPSLQANPADLTNSLLLRILQHNDSFGSGVDPLAPILNVSPSALVAQSILFASLSVTLFVAFIAVLGKQWILYYTRASTWGSIVDRGKERQVKFVGLQKWGLHFIMESLPVLLQFSLLLFGVGLIVYLWEIDVHASEVILAVTFIGCAFYACIAVFATIWSDCPFQTPLSMLLPKVLPWLKETASRVGKAFGGKTTLNQVVLDVYEKSYPMVLSNPALWRQDPLFTLPLEKDTAASAGFWLLENSTDFSAATAVAAVFSEFQWPSHRTSTTALIRLRDTYTQCFRGPVFDRSARLKALQSAAAYYVLYHTHLIWSRSKSCEFQELPAHLPPDLLLLHKDNDQWRGFDLFEYLLRIDDRSVPVESARFLSYIAPYWFCGDSDSAIKFRSVRLSTVDELITVLESTKALNPATLTDCVLCVGAAMDFPLHPEDLIRVDKSDYFATTFKMVVEHIHKIVLAGSRRRRHASQALVTLLTLVKATNLPLVEARWINGLLKDAAKGDMPDGKFALFLRLSARRTEEETAIDAGAGAPEASLSDRLLFKKIMKSIKTCAHQDHNWQDETVYGGLIAIRDIRQLGPSLFDDAALETLYDAMDQGNPFRVRQAAYDVVLVTRDQWLGSEQSRPTLENLDFFRQLYLLVTAMARSDYQQSFLMMLEILSEDAHWHSYLRKAMDIWLPLRHEGQMHVLHILANVGELPPPQWDNHHQPSLDDFLQQQLVDEWAAVPGRRVEDLTTDRLVPLAEVTEQFKELLFDNNYQRAVLAKIEQVIPGLEQRRDYSDPGGGVRGIVNDLLGNLQISPSSRRRSTYWFDN
ncbi:hypothetical protein BJ322DRAFT_168803 [Thelephora terrestris]|uniref:DUF6535 domain-containing protein n=1 Tax=Thelephora terrestris TaxID=56493 RepID=A0A9P6L4B6_9AGAM|nr:hypothetical protein BJ322DRAFT_168803 [Thelephora terrestris]